MSAALINLTSTLAQKFGMGENGEELVAVLKATAFKGPASDAQLTALMIVASQYGLNPWTKEIYAFPDSQNGIVPVVGVDGWSRIINENKQFDGIEFKISADGEECTCTIYRKDRSHPTSVTEYFSECRRDNAKPWKTHPRRMLRHKAMIQCARLAFGYVGIFDQDEAERIIEKNMGTAEVVPQQPKEPPQLPAYPADRFAENLQAWREAIRDGKGTADQLINRLSTKAILSDEQKQALRQPLPTADDDGVIDSDFVAAYEGAE